MENNFEQQIRDAMNNPPEFPYEEKLWNDLEHKLDQKEGKRDKPFMGFVGRLPLFLFAITAASLAGFFYNGQYKAMERIAEIEQQITQQQTQNQTQTEKRITIIYDTIYNKVVIDQIQNTAGNTKGRFVSNNQMSIADAYEFSQRINIPFFTTYHTTAAFKEITATPKLIEEFSQKEGFSLMRKSVEAEVKQAMVSSFDFNTPLDLLSAKEIDFLNITQDVDLPALWVKKAKRKRKLRVYLRELRPSHFALSGMTGTFVSLNLGGNGFNLRGAAQAELGLGKRFALVAGIEYFSNDFNRKIQIDDIDPLDGFPMLPPNNGEDMLQSIQGDFTYMQVPFGIKYTVFPRKYFYPYVGLGLIAGRTTKSRLEYQYSSFTANDYAVSQNNLLPANLEMSAFWTTIGFEIQMNRNWSLLLEGSSQFDLKRGVYKYENLSLLKLGTGLRYEF